ncbi:hypothetical protein [Niabella aurantiaca]|uniref:hypothetical protein n=1 Tax=Niabella aurantiaca TaxID=379900 RepID=UPI00036AECC2|nr:hypothetical protein [Niabella aurantiaca]
MYIGLRSVCLFLFGLVGCYCSSAQDLGSGFYDYGVACPESNDRGVVATTGAGGKNVVLAWLFDHRGGYGLLSIDVASGASRLFDLPFPPGDAPYASILSSDNKFYAYFNNHFAAFDPVKNEFTFSQKAFDVTAMAFTEDDQGLIWAATYPNGGLVAYNPKTRQLVNYGFVNKEPWKQYPRAIAADADGWIYIGIGSTETQIIAFDPKTKETRKLLQGDKRLKGWPSLYRSRDGAVYGTASMEEGGKRIKLSDGVAVFTTEEFKVTNEKPYIAGSQSLFYKKFPDGSVIKSIDFGLRELVVTHGAGEKKVNFKYASEGSLVMAVDVTLGGKLIGGTTFPMRFFEFDPAANTFKRHKAYGQFNASAAFKNAVYFASYPYGALVQYNTDQPVSNDGTAANPVVLGADKQNVHRPHRVLVLDQLGKVLMTGTPEYGYTGGGMLIYNKGGGTINTLADSQLIPDQSTMSMAALDDHRVLAGTTTAPGTGGLKKAKEAVLYLFDAKTLKPIWQEPVFPGTQTYSDLHKAGAVVFGIADSRLFFVFDPIKRSVIYKETLPDALGPVVTVQSPRVFVKDPSTGERYLICRKGILKVNRSSYKLETVALSPVMIEAGGAYYNNKIYFVSNSHLCSYQLN